MAIVAIGAMGKAGVNVDKNPLELDENELTHAQNAVTDPSSGQSTLRKRPGLIQFNAQATAGTVLGGQDLPLADESASGLRLFYIGRGTT